MTTAERGAATAGRYTMVIQWSEVDQTYLVLLPEWQDRLVGRAVAHGATYEEAARSGRDMLELLIEGVRADDESLPEPRTFAATA